MVMDGEGGWNREDEEEVDTKGPAVCRRNSSTFLKLSTFLLLASLPAHVNAALRLEPAYPENTKGIREDGRFIITCVSNRTSNDVNLVWKFNGFPITGDVTRPVYIAPESVTSDRKSPAKLRMLGFSRKDNKVIGGTYTCSSQDRTKRTTEELKFHLEVYDSIRFQGKLDYAVQAGHDVVINCMVILDDDYSSNELYWHFNSTPIDPETSNNRYYIRPSADGKKSSLTIRRVTREDEGPYECRAIPTSKSYTDQATGRYNLVVQYKPEFLDPVESGTAKDVWVPEDKFGVVDVNVTCMVDADPLATFEWKLRDVSGGGNMDLERDKVYVRGSKRVSDNMETVTLRLNASQIIKRDEVQAWGTKDYRITCSATNSLGTAVQVFKIRRGGRPASPQLISYAQGDQKLTLVILEEYVFPPVDYYKITSESNYTITFNATKEELTKNLKRRMTYNVNLSDLDLPNVREKATLSAHNPLGFSNVTFETSEKPVMLFMIGEGHWSTRAVPLTVTLGLLTSMVLLNRRE